MIRAALSSLRDTVLKGIVVVLKAERRRERERGMYWAWRPGTVLRVDHVDGLAQLIEYNGRGTGRATLG